MGSNPGYATKISLQKLFSHFQKCKLWVCSTSVAKVIGILSFTTVVRLYNGTTDRMTARQKEVLALNRVSMPQYWSIFP